MQKHSLSSSMAQPSPTARRRSLSHLFFFAIALLGLMLVSLTLVPRSALADTKDDLAKARTHLDEVNTSLNKANDELFTISTQLETTRSQSVETQAAIKKTKETLAVKRADLVKHIRSDYKSGFSTFLRVLLNTSSLQDIINSIYYSNKISEREGQVIGAVTQDEARLEKLTSELDAQQKSLKASLEKANKVRADYQKQLDDAKEYYNKLDAKVKEELAAEAKKKAEEEAAARKAAQEAAAKKAAEEAAAKQAAEAAKNQAAAEAAAQAAAAQEAAAQRQQQQQIPATRPQPTLNSVIQTLTDQKKSQTPPPAPSVPKDVANAGLRQRVISIAEQYLGVPYVWGGNTPSGFDCSGLTRYVFDQVGIHLARVDTGQRAQITNFKPLSQLLPGDLVWMPGHIGIYIGGGQIIHAPTFGQTVRISPLWGAFLGGGWPSGAPGA